MKAVAKTRAGRGLEIVDVPEPIIRPGHVRIRVEHGSVCGTDLHIFQWDAWAAGRIKPPRVIGHEFCGTVVELGDGVKNVKIGDFVASESHIVDPCDPDYLIGNGHVASTTSILGVDVDGGFAPYAVVPELNARKTPSVVPKNIASLQDALGNAVHTVMDGPVEGKAILITGLGPIGLFAVAICKCLGARKVYATEVAPYRIELAEKLGADIVLNPSKTDVYDILARHEPRGVDGTLEMSGKPAALDLAIEATRPGGRVSLLGVYADTLKSVDFNRIVFKGLRMQGIVGRKMWETWDQMAWLLSEKGLDVSPIVTHEMPYTDIVRAMEILEHGDAGKIVLSMKE
ncbi:MAG: L-threonine 3-dehydrogenase [Fimbriimonadaceae bacterium]|nr:L-threonine 3-dehydrogenase [Fimbriimonadaceae bacterium]QYK56041.1 MAG: L-threonine 3-dehydrogenase [Fimbriimonadaceae bacterium]